MNAPGTTGLLEWGPRTVTSPAPAAAGGSQPAEFTHYRPTVTPIAQHNREMAEHEASYFPPDPGKTPRVFRYIYPPAPAQGERQADGIWLCSPLDPQHRPRAGFLNYDGKSEVLANPAAPAEHLMFKRWDMTDAEFAALPEHDSRKVKSSANERAS